METWSLLNSWRGFSIFGIAFPVIQYCVLAHSPPPVLWDGGMWGTERSGLDWENWVFCLAVLFLFFFFFGLSHTITPISMKYFVFSELDWAQIFIDQVRHSTEGQEMSISPKVWGGIDAIKRLIWVAGRSWCGICLIEQMMPPRVGFKREVPNASTTPCKHLLDYLGIHFGWIWGQWSHVLW